MNIILEEPGAPQAVSMRRSTTTKLPTIPTLRAPLLVRHARMEESDQLAEMLGQAYPTEIWEPSATRDELFHDESIKAVIVVADGKKIFATASLQIPENNLQRGQIRWVATKKSRRREGFAQALVVELALKAAKAGCDEVWLKTTTDLIGAITMYRKLGFEPIVASDEDQKSWTRLLSALDDSAT